MERFCLVFPFRECVFGESTQEMGQIVALERSAGTQ